jgi:hypothetical protein
VELATLQTLSNVVAAAVVAEVEDCGPASLQVAEAAAGGER